MEPLILKYTSPLLAALALTMASTVSADAVPNIKPGLWEMQMQAGKTPGMPNAGDMQNAMKRMQTLMEKMSPEQRKQMQEQMGSAGLSMDGKGMRICMTPEDIKRADIPMDDGKCDTKITSRTATRWAATSTCTQPPMHSEMEAIFTSPTAYSVKVKGTRGVGEHQQAFDMAMNWTHVSSDCGTVKSLSALKESAAAAAALRKEKVR